MGEKIDENLSNEELLKRYHNTKDVNLRNKIITKNEGFVKAIAEKYYHKGDYFDLGDLINEGYIGLIHAIEKFDYKKGYKFLSYAVWWVKKGILEAKKNREKAIRIPSPKNNEILKLDQIIEEYTKMHSENPTKEELSVYLRKSTEYINKLFSYSKKIVPLDSILGSKHEGKMKESLVADECSEIPYENIENNMLIEKILDIAKLSKREEDILKLRYGLGNRHEKTLSEIGDAYNLTKERIRQILDKSKRKIIKRLKIEENVINRRNRHNL